MTTQVLTTSGALLSKTAKAVNDQQPGETDQRSRSAADVAVQARKLPYQANHQVELMHLQAETEALLQRLQTLKQQRLSEVSSQDSELEGELEDNLVISR